MFGFLSQWFSCFCVRYLSTAVAFCLVVFEACVVDTDGAGQPDAAEDTEFEDADGAGMDDFDDDADMNDEEMLDEEEIAEAVEAEEGQMQLQIIDEQAFQEVVNDLAAADPASAAALR